MIHTIQEFSRKRFSSTSTISPTEAGYWYVQALRAEMETMGKQWEKGEWSGQSESLLVRCLTLGG